MRDSERMVQLFSIVHHLQHGANMQCNQKISVATERCHQQQNNQSSQKGGSLCLNVGLEYSRTQYMMNVV